VNNKENNEEYLSYRGIVAQIYDSMIIAMNFFIHCNYQGNLHFEVNLYNSFNKEMSIAPFTYERFLSKDRHVRVARTLMSDRLHTNKVDVLWDIMKELGWSFNCGSDDVKSIVQDVTSRGQPVS